MQRLLFDTRSDEKSNEGSTDSYAFAQPDVHANGCANHYPNGRADGSYACTKQKSNGNTDEWPDRCLQEPGMWCLDLRGIEYPWIHLPRLYYLWVCLQ